MILFKKVKESLIKSINIICTYLLYKSSFALCVTNRAIVRHLLEYSRIIVSVDSKY